MPAEYDPRMPMVNPQPLRADTAPLHAQFGEAVAELHEAQQMHIQCVERLDRAEYRMMMLQAELSEDKAGYLSAMASLAQSREKMFSTLEQVRTPTGISGDRHP